MNNSDESATKPGILGIIWGLLRLIGHSLKSWTAAKTLTLALVAYAGLWAKGLFSMSLGALLPVKPKLMLAGLWGLAGLGVVVVASLWFHAYEAHVAREARLAAEIEQQDQRAKALAAQAKKDAQDRQKAAEADKLISKATQHATDAQLNTMLERTGVLLFAPLSPPLSPPLSAPAQSTAQAPEQSTAQVPEQSTAQKTIVSAHVSDGAKKKPAQPKKASAAQPKKVSTTLSARVIIALRAKRRALREVAQGFWYAEVWRVQ